MPVELKNQLEESAKKSGRSLNAEIVHLLSQAVAELPPARPAMGGPAKYRSVYKVTAPFTPKYRSVNESTDEQWPSYFVDSSSKFSCQNAPRENWKAADIDTYLMFEAKPFTCTRTEAAKQLEIYSHMLAKRVSKPADLAAVEVVMKALVSLVDLKASNGDDDDEAEFLLEPQDIKTPSGTPPKNYNEEL
jgi:hypothetical protein